MGLAGSRRRRGEAHGVETRAQRVGAWRRAEGTRGRYQEEGIDQGWGSRSARVIGLGGLARLMGRDNWLRGWLGRPGLWADDKQRKAMTEKESWLDQEKKETV